MVISQVDKYYFLAQIGDDRTGRIRKVQLYWQNNGAGFRYHDGHPFNNSAFLRTLAFICSRGSLSFNGEEPEIGTFEGQPKEVLAHVHNAAMLCWKVSTSYTQTRSLKTGNAHASDCLQPSQQLGC